MKINNYSKAEEKLLTTTLENGLTVRLLPKKDFNKTFAILTTDFGSMDTTFRNGETNEWETVPDGIAHFLEHKLFEMEEGDAMQMFSSLGASSNAFTNHTKTSYLFETTMNLEKNLLLLLDFVQHPYFPEESVDREKGIIAQEIKMYQDDPDWQLFQGILANLYPTESLGKDIAGTVDSIQSIHSKELYDCYRTFYHPSNMNLFVVGAMDEEALLQGIQENQAKKSFNSSSELQRKPVENNGEVIPHKELRMEVVRPKFSLGIKGVKDLPKDIYALRKYKLSMYCFSELLFGLSSSHFLQMYEDGLVDDSFGEEFTSDRTFHYMSIFGDSEHYDTVVETLKNILLNFENSPEMTEEKLAILKKKLIGKFYQSLNSLEAIAVQFSQNTEEEVNWFDLPEEIEALTLQDVIDAGRGFVEDEKFSTLVILPAM